MRGGGGLNSKFYRSFVQISNIYALMVPVSRFGWSGMGGFLSFTKDNVPKNKFKYFC